MRISQVERDVPPTQTDERKPRLGAESTAPHASSAGAEPALRLPRPRTATIARRIPRRASGSTPTAGAPRPPPGQAGRRARAATRSKYRLPPAVTIASSSEDPLVERAGSPTRGSESEVRADRVEAPSLPVVGDRRPRSRRHRRAEQRSRARHGPGDPGGVVRTRGTRSARPGDRARPARRAAAPAPAASRPRSRRSTPPRRVHVADELVRRLSQVLARPSGSSRRRSARSR